jgi:hypothetical protein
MDKGGDSIVENLPLLHSGRFWGIIEEYGFLRGKGAERRTYVSVAVSLVAGIIFKALN